MSSSLRFGHLCLVMGGTGLCTKLLLVALCVCSYTENCHKLNQRYLLNPSLTLKQGSHAALAADGSLFALYMNSI